MDYRIRELVDVINILWANDVEEKIDYNNLEEYLANLEGLSEISFAVDEENGSREVILVKNGRLYLPLMSDVEQPFEDANELLRVALGDYDNILGKESRGEKLSGWEIYYKIMFKDIFSEQEIEIIRKYSYRMDQLEIFKNNRELYKKTFEGIKKMEESPKNSTGSNLSPSNNLKINIL